ncbi:hypothetical protein BJ944DRAFT_274264 [Cunninghamella echinulata]|nr:hypothetical protein BJ944DRAFT_274264 [Cunninghamella echinulata]
MSIHKLDESIFLKIIHYLHLQDVQTIGQTCKKLHQVVYNNPKIWSHILFPIQDTRITDTFIKQLVPQITRHYGIHHLTLIRLPLTWKGYFFIFDQFAHSVDKIQLETNMGVIDDMVYHLCVFTATLILLQQDNNIPITFRQYCIEPEVYDELLSQHGFLKKKKHDEDKVTFMISLFHQYTLDDPPFERLNEWYTTLNNSSSTDHPSSSEEEINNKKMTQLQFIVSFLANNRHLITHKSLLGQKRVQDHLDSSSRIKQRLLSSPSTATATATTTTTTSSPSSLYA